LLQQAGAIGQSRLLQRPAHAQIAHVAAGQVRHPTESGNGDHGYRSLDPSPLPISRPRSAAVIELRIPVRIAALRRGVEHGPERHQVGRTARVLSRIGSREIHLAAPEVPDRAVAAGEREQAGPVLALLADRMEVAAELLARIGIELECAPAAFLLERDEPLDRRARDDRERRALHDVIRLAVPRAQQRRAHRARPLALRAVHVAVDDERLLVAEQAFEIDGPGLTDEAVVLHDGARRQRAPHLGDAFDLAAQLDLLREQRGARATVSSVLVDDANLAVLRQRLRRRERGVGRHRVPPVDEIFRLRAIVAAVYGVAMTIQPTPNLSATMPKLEAKKVFINGCCTLPPSLSASKKRFASASFFAAMDSEMPLNSGLPCAMPSEAMIVASPTLNEACITFSPSGIGPLQPSPGFCGGASLKRMSILICASSAFL